MYVNYLKLLSNQYLKFKNYTKRSALYYYNIQRLIVYVQNSDRGPVLALCGRSLTSYPYFLPTFLLSTACIVLRIIIIYLYHVNSYKDKPP